MEKIYKLNIDGDTLVVNINENKKVNIKVGEEEVNFFLGHPKYMGAEMEWMSNFLLHRLATSMANAICNDVGAMVGYPAKKEEVVPAELSLRRRRYKHYYIRIYDKDWNVVLERTHMFFTMADAKVYAQETIAVTGKGMKSRISIRKA